MRLGPRQGPANDVLQAPDADHLPQAPPDGRHRLELQQAGGTLVDEQDALVGAQGDYPLDHAAEDGPELLAVFLELGELLGQAVRHVVEGARQRSDFVGAGDIDLVAEAAGGDVLGGLG